MINIGPYTIPTGPDEEVVARPTFWEKLTRKLFPDPWAAEEREALLQHARRLKLKTDLFEQRQKKKAEREELLSEFVPIATQKWQLKSEQLGPYTALFVLEQSRDKKRRKCRVKSIRLKDGSNRVNKEFTDPPQLYIMASNFFTINIMPWIKFQHDTEQLKKNLEAYSKNVTWVA